MILLYFCIHFVVNLFFSSGRFSVLFYLLKFHCSTGIGKLQSAGQICFATCFGTAHAFTFLNLKKKIKYFMTYENYMNLLYQCLWLNFIGTQPHSSNYVLSIATFKSQCSCAKNGKAWNIYYLARKKLLIPVRAYT